VYNGLITVWLPSTASGYIQPPGMDCGYDQSRLCLKTPKLAGKIALLRLAACGALQVRL
jgi:hypothetical protein